MAKKSNKNVVGCLVAVLVAISVGAALLVGVMVTAAMFLPTIMMNTISDSTPLDPGPGPKAEGTADQVTARIQQDLNDNRTVRISPGDLNTLLADTPMDGVPVLQFNTDDNNLVFDMSWQMEPSQENYLNLHVAGDFEMKDGWFTAATIDELEVAGWDLGVFIEGQDMAADLNQGVADARAEDADADAVLRAIESASFEDGVIVLTLTQEGIDEFSK